MAKMMSMKKMSMTKKTSMKKASMKKTSMKKMSMKKMSMVGAFRIQLLLLLSESFTVQRVSLNIFFSLSDDVST